MKTERRHELQHNVLADWLGTKIETVRPYSRAVLGGLIALAVILGVYLYLSKQRAMVAADGWDEYFKAQERLRADPDELSELAQSATYRDTAAGMWARIALADYNYALGEDHLFSDRAQAKQELKTAVDSYTSVANQSEYPLLAQRALLGRARAHRVARRTGRSAEGLPDTCRRRGRPVSERSQRAAGRLVPRFHEAVLRLVRRSRIRGRGRNSRRASPACDRTSTSKA